ncbi:MAG: mannose-1-phosphate guanylyltransferase [Bacteroidales bacterium]
MNNNYCIIMGGGIGSRFWPISTTNRPKQFLDFFGTGSSLLQMTFNRFSKIIPSENIFIVTNENYAGLVHEQLPSLKPEQLLLEPQRRNTAPCIAWASYHIRQLNPNATIVVSPSDHLILNEEEFLQTINRGLEFAKGNNVLLTLGIKPNRPETEYGYIQMDEEEREGFRKVKTFTEKPNLELAKVFLESGEFLWNSGIFLWSADTIIEAMKLHQPEITARFEPGIGIYATADEKEFIAQNFPACPNISIDFGVMEKASNVFMLEANFGWSDLGTWGALYELSDRDENNNVSLKCQTMAYESSNNIVSLPQENLVVIQGLEDYIVAQDNNVLLICKKDDEQKIRQYVTDAKLKYGDRFI